MQLYHGTYLNTGKFTIPKGLLNNANFFKYSKLNVYIVVKNGILTKTHVLSDDIQIVITPYPYEKLKFIYFFELSMPNVKGATVFFLEIFKKNNVNILDCRGVDEGEKPIGKMELIAELQNSTIITTIEEEIRKREGCDINHILLFDEQSIVIDNYERIASIKYCPQKIKSSDLIIRDYSLTIQSDSKTITYRDTNKWNKLTDRIKNLTSCYLSIISFSERNLIIVKFKSITEKILPLYAEFRNNEEGVLYDVINSLWKAGVNLKLINSIISYNREEVNQITSCNIFFDYAKSSLDKGYSREDIEEIIKSQTREDVIIKIPNENFIPGPGWNGIDCLTGKPESEATDSNMKDLTNKENSINKSKNQNTGRTKMP